MRFRTEIASALLVFASMAPDPSAAQVNEQRSGTVESIEGTTLTLLTNAPPRRLLGPDRGAPPALPTLVVDLDEVPASQWVFLRPGERIAVVGLPKPGGRFAAIAIIGGAGPRRDPQAP
jgi:hypothetical protein